MNSQEFKEIYHLFPKAFMFTFVHKYFRAYYTEETIFRKCLHIYMLLLSLLYVFDINENISFMYCMKPAVGM